MVGKKKSGTEGRSRKEVGKKKIEKKEEEKRVSGGQSFSHVLGQIMWLLGKSGTHRYLFIQELEWLIYPPVMQRQFMLFFNEKKQVVGVAMWALVSEEVEKRLEAGQFKLRPGEWRSGERLWLIEIVAPFGKAEEMLKQLKGGSFRGREFKTMGVNPKTGKSEVRVMQGDSVVKKMEKNKTKSEVKSKAKSKANSKKKGTKKKK